MIWERSFGANVSAINEGESLISYINYLLNCFIILLMVFVYIYCTEVILYNMYMHRVYTFIHTN